MKKNKRMIGILLSLFLILGTSNMAFAATNTITHTSGKVAPSKVFAYVKPSFSVQLNEKMQIFKDVNGQKVYPLVYNGSTYLPVRAISAIMKEDIEWDNYSRTVFIGKTLSNPNKSRIKKHTENIEAAHGVDKEDYVEPTWKSASVTVSVRPDIIIMYDFEIQNFTDASGNKAYPIIYNGSTYLPVRSISGLMNQPIEWDNVTKTVMIGNENTNTEEEVKLTIYTKKLKAEFEDAIETYDQATDKIVDIQKATDAAVKAMLADSISADLQVAEKQTISINKMRKSKMTEEEKVAQAALYDFAQISQHYLLVLENISYLSAAGEDYSMLSETFLNFAMASQKKMNKARDLIEAL